MSTVFINPDIYIYRIMYTMCPPGYHHNGFMATPELGHRMYGYIYIYINTIRYLQ